MDNQITLKEALALVEFEICQEGWRVKHVKGDVCGNVQGDVCGNVQGDVWLDVGGTIRGRQWKFSETPKKEPKHLENSNG